MSKPITLSIVFVSLILITLPLSAFGDSDALSLPAWRNIYAEPVSPDDAIKIIESRGDEESPIEPLALSGIGSGDRITELVRGLKNDPCLIYKYVRDNIEYVPIYGYIKGPEMTLLDGAGNDFDQAALLVTLFRQSGFTANYIYGRIRLYPAQLTDWLGIANNPNVVGKLFSSAGITPTIAVNGDVLVYVEIDHVWVKVNIGGVDYVFDPSFKEHSSTSGINLQSAMGYNSATFLTRASAGTTINSNYIQNVNKPNITADLNSYSTNLINYIKTNSPAATLKEIIGGRTIVPAASVPYQTMLPYQRSITYNWTEIPNTYKVSLRIQHQGIDVTKYSEQIYGKRLTIFYNTSNKPVLALDGTTLATGSTATPGATLPITFIVNHPYASSGGAYGDETQTFQIIAGGSYFIVNGWAGTGTKVIDEHRKILRQNRYAGGSNTSEPVLGESLAMLGLTWLAECSRAGQITDQIAGTITISHHELGICGQNQSPYIDMPMCLSSYVSKTGNTTKEQAIFFASSGQSSAFEWGVVEQLQPDNTAVSTVKLVDIANNVTYNKIFEATSSNYTGTVKPQLHNYSTSELSNVETYINAGFRVILPQEGDLGEDEWKGIGFLAVSSDETAIGHIISGGLSGGYGTIPWTYTTPPAQIQTTKPSYISSPVSPDPIDLLSGDYLYDNTDLTIGSGDFPFSLGIKRSYNSSSSLDDGPMGLGWKHSLDITAKVSSDGFEGLGKKSPIDAATSIVESYVSLDMLSSTRTNLRLTAASMAHRWFMDKLIDNVVTIDQPGNTMQFVKLPDGSYNPPPGVADTLTYAWWNEYYYYLSTKHGEGLEFDPDGKIKSWSDPNNKIDFTYNANKKISQVSNQFGRSLTFTYNTSDANHVARVTDSAGRFVQYGYGTQGNLTSVIDANGFTTEFYYDPANDGRITSIYYPTKPYNAYVYNVYDALGRVKTQTNANNYTYQYYYTGYRTEETDPYSHSKVYFYDDQSNLIAQTDPLGNKVTYKYDGQRRKTLITYPLGNASRCIYDPNHNVMQSIQIPVTGSGEPNIVETFTYEHKYNRIATHTDPNGGVTTYQYYPNGKVRYIYQPQIDGNTPCTTFTYNAKAQPLTITDPMGVITKNQYDANYKLISTIVDYGGLNITASMTYNNVGDVNSTTDPRGNKTAYLYDPMRRLIKSTSPPPFNYVTIYKYNPDGTVKELSRQTETGWQTTTSTYTNSGKILTATDPNGDVTSYQYNNTDLLWKVTDAKNNLTTNVYDAADRLSTVIDANNVNSVTYTYNPNGSIETLKDAKNNTTTYQYDGHNRLKKTTYPNSTYEELTYNTSGSISQSRNRAGQIISFSYDSLDRLKTKTLPGPTYVQYTYDLISRLKSVTDVTGTMSNIYDKAGRLLNVKYQDNKTVSYLYDAASNRIRLTYPDSTYITYDYDNLSRLTYIRDSNSSSIAHYDYDKLSRRTGSQFGNGTSASYGYNVASRLMTLNNQLVSSTRNFAYTYDKVGNRTTMTTDGLQHIYTYDKIYQLTAVDYPAGFFATDTTFRYDKAGNRSSVIAGSTTAYVPNNLNQYSSVGGTAFTYDNNGNLTYDGQFTYIYDCENRLLEVKQGASTIAQYTYDFSGRRIRKTTDAGLEISKYLYDGDRIICEYNSGGQLLRKFVYGTGIDEVVRLTTLVKSANIINMLGEQPKVNFGDFAVIAKSWLLDTEDAGYNPAADLMPNAAVDYQDLAVLADNWLGTGASVYEKYYYHYDGLGSVIALSSISGSQAESYKYDVYGRVDYASSIGNPYLFTGRQYDPETGNYYYRARYYNPKIGRFLQTDPTGYDDGVNWYSYCGNDPINMVDPSGTSGSIFNTGILCGPTLDAMRPPKKPEAWVGYIPVSGPIIKARYELYQGNYGEATWDMAMAASDMTFVAKSAQLIGKAGEIGWNAAGKNLLYGELGGDKTTKLYGKLGLEGLDETAKYAKLLKAKGGGLKGAVKTFLPEITTAYIKTIPKGLTLASSLGLSASMRGFDYVRGTNDYTNDSTDNYKNGSSLGGFSSSYNSGGK